MSNGSRFPFWNHGRNWAKRTASRPPDRWSERPRSSPWVRLSKIIDYLIDNLHVPMLSKVKARGQAQSGGAADAVPTWESGTGLCAKGTGHPESDLSVRDRLGQPPNSIPEIGPLVPNYS
jgi:hypothetical protein